MLAGPDTTAARSTCGVLPRQFPLTSPQPSSSRKPRSGPVKLGRANMPRPLMHPRRGSQSDPRRERQIHREQPSRTWNEVGRPRNGPLDKLSNTLEGRSTALASIKRPGESLEISERREPPRRNAMPLPVEPPRSILPTSRPYANAGMTSRATRRMSSSCALVKRTCCTPSASRRFSARCTRSACR